jgi:signal transduction histidine kinase
LRGVAERERYAALELELDLADGEVVVAAGPDRLARVFENLIDNAAAFSKNGHVRLSSRVEGHEAVAVVDDDGPGIPPEHGDKVFDRFFSYRPDANAAGSSDHSGLGLAIVRAILERRGGSIRTVSSTLGGAGFEVRLNLA